MDNGKVKCEACGAEMAGSTQFCPQCGRVNAAYYKATGQEPAYRAKQQLTQQAAPAYSGETVSVAVPQTTQAHTPQPQPKPAPVTLVQQTPQYKETPRPLPTSLQVAPQPYAQEQNYPVPVASPAPVAQAQYSQPVVLSGPAPQDSTIAFLLELVGYAGFLGIGHIYAGRVARGIGIMVAYWAYGLIALFIALTIIGIPLALLMAVAYPIVPIISGLWIKSDLDKEHAHTMRRFV
jgi:hypothetical protein